MRLDTIFNIIGDNGYVMLKDIMGMQSNTRRMVDTFIKREKGYKLEQTNVEFSTFV